MPTEKPDNSSYQVCIAGGGPAGLMLGYLLARSGIKVIVVEKHKDFLRDFRGDTIHPSTLELMHELGVLKEFLERPHQKLTDLKLNVAGESVTLADFSNIKAQCQFLAFMPQWDFLDFIADQAKNYANFQLIRQCKAVKLLRNDSKVVGIEAQGRTGTLNIAADITIAADGRGSTLRDDSNLEVQSLGAPMDVIWMSVSKDPNYKADYLGHFGQGQILITIDRGDYWQCALVIAKGEFEAFKQQGIEHLRSTMVKAFPSLADNVHEIKDWNDCFLLTVTVDRLTQWWQPGLLCIGDAAHAMSPVGGVGINLAIQDAVAAANQLVPTFLAKGSLDVACAKIQKRREFPSKITQAFQLAVQKRVIRKVIESTNANTMPLPLRILQRFSFLQSVPARFVGLGVRQEHIHTPDILKID
jgi:2-polyprenyl-6-methoxyphenol hydroxylase-like FAD-dependent oxidoreductase